MKTFNVKIYRNGTNDCFVEEFDIKADEFYSDKETVCFINDVTPGHKCDGSYFVAQFKADKYTIIEKSSII